ncbi:hypothetical protein N6L26_11050 [Qipengyuania sp. SS22]|uniref:hypothetical protein n=1 Tax=Qipengyuania sp. SS22 TaxID=2979461 RepID=UPI0021E538B2|nr:hypothetical protein [Qipengyuania sp. SS22]UYH54575.1 hypothetical protein N6L26_11050 [Qipengyuania sp. SS22]
MAAILPSLGYPAAAAWAGEAISIPTRPFLLRRELERGLARGASLLVTREWEGRFETIAGHTRVTGEQVSCTVDAPAVLEPIAAVERARRSPGPFPAHLDTGGRMIGSQPTSTEGTAAAVQAAIEVLERSGKSAAEMQEAKRYLAELAKTAGTIIGTIPPDLFFPVTGEARDSRELPLPGGLMGEFAVELEASATTGGLLERFERRITTRIAEDVRLSRETWRLSFA